MHDKNAKDEVQNKKPTGELTDEQLDQVAGGDTNTLPVDVTSNSAKSATKAADAEDAYLRS
jgi:hypothetical protein